MNEKVYIRAQRLNRPALISSFSSMKWQEVSLVPPWMGLSTIAGLPPRIKFTSTHLYTWVKRGTVRVRCFAQEHNTMSLARAGARTTRSGGERTNHEATAPLSLSLNAFSSPGAALLLVSSKNRVLLEGSTTDVRVSQTSGHSAYAWSQVWQICLAENTKLLFCACSENWTFPEVAIDQ